MAWCQINNEPWHAGGHQGSHEAHQAGNQNDIEYLIKPHSNMIYKQVYVFIIPMFQKPYL